MVSWCGKQPVLSFSSLMLGLIMVTATLGLLTQSAVARPLAAVGATIGVTTTLDGTIDLECSLRDAINSANIETPTSGCVAGSGSDTITLPPGTYTLSMAGNGEDNNATGDLDATDPDGLTISGAGVDVTILNANGLDRVLHATAGNLTLQNLTIRNGYSTDNGGGVHIANAGHITNVKFISNTAGFNGGGLYLYSGSTITGSSFISNVAGSGGGVGFYDNAPALIAHTLFSGNVAVGLYGGGAYFGSTAELQQVQFINNRAPYGGGGAQFYGHAVIENSTFTANAASGGNGRGGGASFTNSADIVNSRFSRNWAADIGGAVYFYGISNNVEQISNSLLAENSAKNSGMAIYAHHDNSNDTLTLLNNTIATPTLSNGAAVRVVQGRVTMTNTLIANYAVGIRQSDSGTVFEDYTLFSGVTTPYTYTTVITSGGHSITGTAAFVNTTTYKISSLSDAKDNGFTTTLTTDFEGDSRPQGLRFDIGYDEYAYLKGYLPLILK